ncbi:unnamed protein product [Rhodiola kirilowii]
MVGRGTGAVAKKPKTVTYDGRSLIIDGKEGASVLGSIHYLADTPDTWPTLLRRAKEGGLNAIQTSVFWNNSRACGRPVQFYRKL